MADDDKKPDASGKGPLPVSEQPTYHLLGQEHDDKGGVLWRELSQVKAASSDAALAIAAELQRTRLSEPGQTGSVEVTVAVVSDRFWVEGTATTEVKPVTTWARP